MDVPSLPMKLIGACSCGACTFKLSQDVKARLRCHCTICQAFTGRAYSDVAIIPALRVTLRGASHVTYRKYKRFRFPPPNLDRGRCRTCGQPVVESIGPGPLKLMFLPAANFNRPEALPPIGAHIFYEHRRGDAEDEAPKYRGYFPSQAAIATLIMRAL